MKPRIMSSLSLLCIMVAAGVFCTQALADLQEVHATDLPGVPVSSQTDPKADDTVPIQPSQQDTEHRIPETPDDPCLPALYKDWLEFSLATHENGSKAAIENIRVLINRSNYYLSLEVVEKGRAPRECYRTTVALGDPSSPTPSGRFVINHIYCYPDVLFFDSASEKVSELYNGFFAPLLLCEEYGGRCSRYNDLGIHGFRGSAHPNFSAIRPDTYGAVSGGCIRLPDPCSFKHELIRAVGVGPVKKNDRGSYHWLRRPVEVLIEGNYPGAAEDITIVDIVQKSLTHITGGLRSVLESIGK